MRREDERTRLNCKLNSILDALIRFPRAKSDLERVQTRRFRGRNSSDFLDKNEDRENPLTREPILLLRYYFI